MTDRVEQDTKAYYLEQEKLERDSLIIEELESKRLVGDTEVLDYDEIIEQLSEG